MNLHLQPHRWLEPILVPGGTAYSSLSPILLCANWCVEIVTNINCNEMIAKTNSMILTYWSILMFICSHIYLLYRWRTSSFLPPLPRPAENSAMLHLSGSSPGKSLWPCDSSTYWINKNATSTPGPEDPKDLHANTLRFNSCSLLLTYQVTQQERGDWLRYPLWSGRPERMTVWHVSTSLKKDLTAN